MVKFSAALVLLLGTACAGSSDGSIRGTKDASNKYDYGKKKGVVVLETFDNPSHVWKEMNDPVMGGRSTGTFTIEDGVAKFEGEVVDVPFLKAPGFLQARSVGGPMGDKYPDISHCSALQIIAKPNIAYKGFRVSIGNAHAPNGNFFAYGYKASFSFDGAQQQKKRKDGFDVVTIPIEDFTDFWDDKTGDPIKTCKENSLYCPDEKTLKNIQRLTLWAEGVAGRVSLEVKAFQAVGCGNEAASTSELLLVDESFA